MLSRHQARLIKKIIAFIAMLAVLLPATPQPQPTALPHLSTIGLISSHHEGTTLLAAGENTDLSKQSTLSHHHADHSHDIQVLPPSLPSLALGPDISWLARYFVSPLIGTPYPPEKPPRFI